MDITLKNLAFDAKPIDPTEELARIAKGKAVRPPHEVAILKQLAAALRVLVISYDCATTTVTATNVDSKWRMVIKRELKVVGLGKSGKASSKRTAALRDAIVAAAGYADPFELSADLTARFGEYEATVPYQKFMDKFGPKQSFTVHAEVDWLVFELTPKAPLAKGSIFAAVPFHVRYDGAVIYDCRKSKAKQPDALPVHDRDGREMNPKDVPMRKVLRAELKQRIKDLSVSLKYADDRLMSAEVIAEMHPEDYDAQQELKSAKRRVKEIKDKIAQYDKQQRRL